MGFSVSGSAAIIFAGMFIGFGILHGAASNSFERVADAEDARTDAVLETRNSDLAIQRAEHANGTLTVEVTNTGSAPLSLPETDLLLDGEYVEGWQATATVNGDAETDLWLPGERLTITVDRSPPSRVRVVGDPGIADTTTEVR